MRQPKDVKRIILLLFLFSVFVQACRAANPAAEEEGSSEVARPAATATEAQVAGSAAAATAVRPTREPAVTATSQPTPTSEPTTEPATVRLVDAPGLREIEVLTPTTGAGLKPRFAWEAVEGAARYSLLVYEAGGHPYWAWEGEATAVYLGGGDTAPAATSAGPILQAEMTWGVLAFDARGTLLASSAVHALSK